MFAESAAAVALAAVSFAGAMHVSTSGPVHVTRHHVSWETVTVRAPRCITNVEVYVVSADGQDEDFSGASHAHGRTVRVRIPFSNLSEGGTWHVSDVFATPCGSHREIEVTPNDARFIVRH